MIILSSKLNAVQIPFFPISDFFPKNIRDDLAFPLFYWSPVFSISSGYSSFFSLSSLCFVEKNRVRFSFWFVAFFYSLIETSKNRRHLPPPPSGDLLSSECFKALLNMSPQFCSLEYL